MITSVTGGGKVRVVQHNLLVPYGSNIEGDSGNEESQQEADDPQDSIPVDSDGEELEANVVLIDPKPVGEGDAICVQHLQIEEKLDYWTQSILGC